MIPLLAGLVVVFSTALRKKIMHTIQIDVREVLRILSFFNKSSYEFLKLYIEKNLNSRLSNNNLIPSFIFRKIIKHQIFPRTLFENAVYAKLCPGKLFPDESVPNFVLKTEDLYKRNKLT